MHCIRFIEAKERVLEEFMSLFIPGPVPECLLHAGWLLATRDTQRDQEQPFDLDVHGRKRR